MRAECVCNYNERNDVVIEVSMLGRLNRNRCCEAMSALSKEEEEKSMKELHNQTGLEVCLKTVNFQTVPTPEYSHGLDIIAFFFEGGSRLI